MVLLVTIYRSSPNTRKEISRVRLMFIISTIYISISIFYVFKLIPPVPLALNEGIAAHGIERKGGKYTVSFEPDEWYVFWRNHHFEFTHYLNEKVYIFSSIFAPSNLRKAIFHRWKWYNERLGKWELVEDIGFEIQGGRDGGFRGYTYKQNVKDGTWQVEVLTEEEMVLGVIDFKITTEPNRENRQLIEKKF